MVKLVCVEFDTLCYTRSFHNRFAVMCHCFLFHTMRLSYFTKYTDH